MEHNAERSIGALPGGIRFAPRRGMLRLLMACALVAAPLVPALAEGPTGPIEQMGPVETPTPFSILLDFEPLRAAPEAEATNYPIWLESVELPSPANGVSVVRLRLRAFPGLSDRLLLRLFFFDRTGESDTPTGPTVIGWSETGRELYIAGPLGLGLGLPASESLVIPAEGIDYLEISVPNDPHGLVLRQALVASLKTEEKLTALDFGGVASLADPFTREAAILDPTEPPPEESDTFLFGRVRAVLHPGPVRLTPGNAISGTVHFRFHLGSVPLLAMAAFSVHHADPTAPLQAWINGEPIGNVALQLPDLADPAYLAAPQRFSATRFRYAGWLPAQIAFPGRLLRVGENVLSLQIPEEAAPVVLHRLELQLKNHWQKLDTSIP